MTRKNYLMLEEAIARADKYDDGELIGPAVVASIADALAADNPRFDRARFMEACGV